MASNSAQPNTSATVGKPTTTDKNNGGGRGSAKGDSRDSGQGSAGERGRGNDRFTARG